MKKYWIIDLESLGEDKKSATGPFKSVADAEEWLREDARESFSAWNEYDNLGPQTDWASPVLIVKEINKVKQVPVLNFTVKLEEVK